jgi:hypothetical protein
MKNIAFILFMFCAFTIKAQQNLVLNGSFEQITLNYCFDYFNSMSTSTVTSVTNYSGSFTYIHRDSCLTCNPQVYWGGGAQNGHWFILMEGDYGNNGVSKISFNLDSPLSNEKNYRLSFFIKMPPKPAPCQDTIKNNYVKVGLSNNPNQFGTLLYTSPLGTNDWQEYSLVFNTQNAEEYLTVEAGVGDTNHWVIFADNFVLEETTASAVNEVNTNNKQLLKIVDILGKESSPNKKGLLFYIYSDGTVEKKLIIE